MAESAWLIEWDEAGRVRYLPSEAGVVAFDANLAARWFTREGAERHLKHLRGLHASYYSARVAEHEWPDSENTVGGGSR